MTDKAMETQAAEKDSRASEDDETPEQLWASFDKGDTQEDDAETGDTAQDGDNPDGDDTADGSDDSDAGDEGAKTTSRGKGDAGDDAQRGDKAAAEDPAEQFRRLQNNLKAEKGRRKKAQSERDEMKAELAELKRRLDAQAKRPAPRPADESLKQAKEDYPEIVGPILEQMKDMQSRVEDLNGRERAQLKRLTARYDSIVAEEEDALYAEHPDYDSFMGQHGQTFMAWVDDQPKEIRDIVEKNAEEILDGEGAAMVLANFKAALKGATGGADRNAPARNNDNSRQDRRSQQREGARSVRSSTGTATTSAPHADSEDLQGHWKALDKVFKRGA